MQSHLEADIVDVVLHCYRQGISKAEIGRIIIREFGLDITQNAARKRAERIIKAEHPGLTAKAQEAGLPAGQVKSYWYKDKNYSIQVRVPDSDGLTLDEVADRLKDTVKAWKPEYDFSDFDIPTTDETYLLIIDPADVHIGKLAASEESGDSYDNHTAVARLVSGVIGIQKSAAAFPLDQIVLVGGNDILHVDGPSNTTSRGTRQDVSALWWQSFEDAKNAYIRIIEYLRQIAPVHFIYNPSNHDYANGYLLSQVVEAWFSGVDGVTFDTSISHRKYYRYHNNLIGTTHGDGAKMDMLPLLAANEAKEAWASCSNRYIYTHHIHHKVAKDYPGVTIESIRSPSGSDSWHHKMGFQHAPKAIEGFVHHKEKGQVFRITHNFG